MQRWWSKLRKAVQHHEWVWPVKHRLATLHVVVEAAVDVAVVDEEAVNDEKHEQDASTGEELK